MTKTNAANSADTAATTAIATVLEVRQTRSGAIRAYCQTDAGKKVAVYAKNGNGQTLLEAVGRKVFIKYQVVDRGWFAYQVVLAAS